MIRKLSILAATALFACAASAQSGAVHYREGQRVDPQEVARILGHQAPIKTRSIRLLDSNEKASQGGGTPSALSLPVRFGFDSAEVAPAARPQLDALAEGIKLLPPGAVVMVEGHTDAVGSEEYNQRLSERRAHAVKNYLVKQHGIDPKRLLDTGVGKAQPIEGAAPDSPQNRRVQFRGA